MIRGPQPTMEENRRNGELGWLLSYAMATDGGSGNWVRYHTLLTDLMFHAIFLQQPRRSSSDKGFPCLKSTERSIISAEAGQLMMYAWCMQIRQSDVYKSPGDQIWSLFELVTQSVSDVTRMKLSPFILLYLQYVCNHNPRRYSPNLLALGINSWGAQIAESPTRVKGADYDYGLQRLQMIWLPPSPKLWWNYPAEACIRQTNFVVTFVMDMYSSALLALRCHV